jgi:plasmid stability protein
MSELVIDNLEDDLRARLERLARDHGHSLAEEVRDILLVAVALQIPDDSSEGLGTRIAHRFVGIGLQQDISEWRGHLAEPINFES